uniref:Uncharacterized protein n=1 Tax=Rhizophora mucronata TaxID=61149 RepID=A0A2P2JJH5_RHIMU
MVNKELLILPKIKFCSNKNNRNPRIIMPQFWNPLISDVLIASLANQREGKDKDICFRIAQRPQPIIILVTSSIPQSQIDGASIHNHIGTEIFESSVYIVLFSIASNNIW